MESIARNRAVDLGTDIDQRFAYFKLQEVPSILNSRFIEVILAFSLHKRSRARELSSAAGKLRRALKDMHGTSAQPILRRELFPKSMSLPGLGLAAQPEADYHPAAIHGLKEGAEWRFEVPFDSKVQVKVHPRTLNIAECNSKYMYRYSLEMQSSLAPN